MTPTPSPTDTAKATTIRVDSIRATRWIWRAAPVVMVACGLLLWLSFGSLRVPDGMDGIPSIPPGSLCIIDKRQGSIKVGSAVFADLPEGATVLSRVAELIGDSMRLANDDPQANMPDSTHFGNLPLSALRGVVLVVFAGDGEPGEVLRGK